MQKTIQITMQVEKLDHLERLIDVELEIEATYTLERGDYHNPRIEEIEIESVFTEDGDEWELSSSDERRARELLWEQV
jgi:RNA-binding protein YlmH